MDPPRRRREAENARRRFRSKINQRRYRARSNASHHQLEEEVGVLAAATHRLEGHVGAIERGLWCHAEELSVLEYYRLMAAGYAATPRQDMFLHHFVAPDVAFMGHTGVDAIRAMWDSYNTYFASVRLECQHLVSVFASSDCVVVEAVVVTRLQVSKTTIQCIFPHLLLRPDLLLKMIDRDVELPFHVVFTFDATKNSVKIESEVNLVSALLTRFGNLGDVTAVLATSGIQPNGMLVSQVAAVDDDERP
ncbi:Aste57867_19917 [Aphanomyces stellatus]|uniref:Aste57867_19917 protein n=1 Tax=Aphanomyces stellatus TaxID=120398 RepID=A0A485LEC0_9STRA|nr:hypothetical protein As57867_019851 [Aphanomyces stellatus]VFT96615.1 Aste57867_19917 [Aphanomyces stellatus]